MKKTLLLLLFVVFSKLNIQGCTIVANAGPDMTICANNSTVSLNGSISGATGGTWSGGAGTFSDPNSLTATYTPSAGEVAMGMVTLTLTSTGNGTCAASSDQVAINITPAPVVSAGENKTVCGNSVSLSGSVAIATGGIWSTIGTGTFTPDGSSLSSTYTFSAEDTSKGIVFFALTSTGNGACTPVQDSMVVTIAAKPVLEAGDVNQSACGSEISLSASVTSGFEIEWDGSGIFSPNNTTKSVTYQFTADEISFGNAILHVRTIGDFSCHAYDSLFISIAPKAVVNAGSDDTTGEYMVNLNGSVTNANGATWSSTGTGSFSPSAGDLKASYIFSDADKTTGVIYLMLNSFGENTCSIATDTLKLEYKKTYSIVGAVRAGDMLLDKGIVFLYKEIDTRYTLLNTRVIQNSWDTAFYFPGNSLGKYLLFAAPDSLSQYYGNYLPSYFGATTEWNKATAISVTEGYLQDFNTINLVANTSTNNTWNTGTDKISGVITESTSSPTSRMEGGTPVSNAIVYLLDENGQKLSYTTTDANGNYSFKNIKAATYQIKVEYAGVQYTAPATVISDGDPTTTETVSVETSKEIITSISFKEKSNLLKLFPVPAEDILTVSLLEKGIQTPVKAFIYNTSGQVLSENELSSDNSQINVNKLPKGMYIIKLFSKDKFYVEQFTKN